MMASRKHESSTLFATLRRLLGNEASRLNLESSEFDSTLQSIARLNPDELSELLELADQHHVWVRVMALLQHAAGLAGNDPLLRWTENELWRERARAEKDVQLLKAICDLLEQAGWPATIIKSLDHWPDLGSDFDLFTRSHPEVVVSVLTKQFHARVESRSWGDRLANKWNFRVPGLSRLIEIHVKVLGQTGEQEALGCRLENRRLFKSVARYCFSVPAPEEQIVIATLQRMYRHFYIRLCDILDVAHLLENNAIDFRELKTTADLGGVWPGVATFLVIVAEYANEYGFGAFELPHQVRSSARFDSSMTYIARQYVRVPILPQAAGLYLSQLLSSGSKVKLSTTLRLSLLPPLAAAAFLGTKITGSDKGIW
ncbi:MAG TPA: hypothetical protein VEG30_08165 [Terriglobales bacterium]|nr:hypothetical protein [Terriglobales bacterium]